MFFKKKDVEISVPTMNAGEYGDVVAIRHPHNDFKRYTNIKWLMGDNMNEAEDFEWGYSGGGPADFALNILLHFTDGNEAFSRACYLDFRDEFLAPLPRAGGTIPKVAIFNFIMQMRELRAEEIKHVQEQLALGSSIAQKKPSWLHLIK